ncbi:MAG: hypothetical protein V9G20_04080 [Candidatus Promineifilaceae bacterium]
MNVSWLLLMVKAVELLRKCRAIWQIARTIYKIVLQIFIPLGAP